MRDDRIDKWAEVLVHYSLRAEEGQSACIFSDVEALPLVEACYEKLLQAGVHVEYSLGTSYFQEIFYEFAKEEQLKRLEELRFFAAQHFDLLLFIHAPGNTSSLTNVDPRKIALKSTSSAPFLDTVFKRSASKAMRWCRTDFPTTAAAQSCGIGNREYESFVFDAGHLNHSDPIAFWKELKKQQQKAIDYLEDKKELHFKTEEGTDLRVNIEGMHWENCAGEINFPDGEVFSGPNLAAADGGVNGFVRYTFPTVFKDVEVDGIELTFEKGAVVDAKASKNEDFLRTMIAQDDGAKFVGEIAIGTNFHVDKGTKSILFDEKIGGSFHTAVGQGYPQTGNTNQSGLHWDMICDLRCGGKIFADGELIFADGRFVIDGWPG